MLLLNLSFSSALPLLNVLYTSIPLKKTSPEVGGSKFNITFAVVVLPQPLSPTNAKVSPLATEKLTWSTACTCPILLLLKNVKVLYQVFNLKKSFSHAKHLLTRAPSIYDKLQSDLAPLPQAKAPSPCIHLWHKGILDEICSLSEGQSSLVHCQV